MNAFANGPQGVGKKLNTPLLFAPRLDMRPFLSSTVMQQRCCAGGKAAGGAWLRSAAAAAAAPDAHANGCGAGEANGRHCMYELYAVVCHRGNLQARVLATFAMGCALLHACGSASLALMARFRHEECMYACVRRMHCLV